MRLSRGYQWKLELSDNELKIICKCLRACVDDNVLDEAEEGLAEHLYDTIEEYKYRGRKEKRHKTVSIVETGDISGDSSEDLLEDRVD